MATTVVNLRKEPYDVYIGRAGKGEEGYFGNPYPLAMGDRDACLERYRHYFEARLNRDKEFKRRIEALKGKRLGCFCKPLKCHGDIIVEYLEGK